MGDVYRKVGRGGAGNFYSQKDVEEHLAQTAAADDVEAQKPAPADELPSDPAVEQQQHQQPPTHNSSATTSDNAQQQQQQQTVYGVRTGRGGAGNFIDPETAAAAEAEVGGGRTEPSIRQHAQPRPPTVHSTGNQSFVQRQQQQETDAPPPPPRLSGRGGAGNWGSGPSEAERRIVDEEQERKRREALDKHIFDDVRAGLKEPGRAHTRVQPHGRGAGMKGFEES